MATDTAGFADPAPLTDNVRRLAATGAVPATAPRTTRIVYCLALIGFPLGIVGASSSWVGSALAGGPIAALGPPAFFIAAAVLYRVYRVTRYPAALDARPPSRFGNILRNVASNLMAVGAAGLGGLFLSGPLAPFVFGGGGPDGIVIFLAGVVALLMASAGWIGCALFEASRQAGSAAPPRRWRTRRQRLQDWSVAGVLTLLAVVLPTAFKVMNPEPCFELSACVAQVEGRVARRLAVALGVPIALQSNIEGIEYQQTHGNETWVRTEIPVFSLLRAGHPVALTSEGPVQVSVRATPVEEGVIVVLTVSENGEQTARFTTHFASGARIVSSGNVAGKLVIILPRGVMQGGKEAPGEGALDALHQQMRRAIGFPNEVAEEARG